MRINYKKLIIFILITFIIGSFFSFFNDTYLYDTLNKPIDIPSIVFIVVWTILYLLMAISAYIISESNVLSKINALLIYFIQLIVNSLWTLFFFGFELYLFSFAWILLLIILVSIMIYKFYKINKTSAYLNIPYLLWIILAAYLNYMIYYLN
ncbi:MAG: TspO/MBR family protein [Ignavibacteriales bacterium]